jgi:hypothetical protein
MDFHILAYTRLAYEYDSVAIRFWTYHKTRKPG